MSTDHQPNLIRHRLKLHFGVALDLLVVVVGLFCLALFAYLLPVTCRNFGQTSSLPSFQSAAIILWNVSSLITVALAVGIAVFLPSNRSTRQRTQKWLAILLCCQPILLLALLGDHETIQTIFQTLGPGWLAVLVVILLQHVDMKLINHDQTITNDSRDAQTWRTKLKAGLCHLGAIIFVLIGAAMLFALPRLVTSAHTQIASSNWPTATANVVQCQTLESDNPERYHSFVLKYEFQEGDQIYSGHQYDMIGNDELAVKAYSAEQIVDRINRSGNVQVAYNPVNPNQNLVAPGITLHFTVWALIGLIPLMFHIGYSAYGWKYLMKRRSLKTDTGSKTIGKLERFMLTSVILVVSVFGTGLLTHRIPIPAELIGLLMLTIGIAASYSFLKRLTTAEQRKQKQQESEKATGCQVA